MSAASSTEAWLSAKLQEIEEGIKEFEQEHGRKPEFVLVRFGFGNYAQCMDIKGLDDWTPEIRAEPCLVEVVKRHKAGAYLGKDGALADVPIIGVKEVVYFTSLETMRRNQKGEVLPLRCVD